MESPHAIEGLSFERAVYTNHAGRGMPCGNCAGPLGPQYWQWHAKPFCARCRGGLTEVFAASQSKRAFGRAVSFGGLVALGSGIAYAVFAALVGRWALLTVGIGFLIARVIRHCSGGIGGRKYQVLAVVLTYLAATMGYVPSVYKGFESVVHENAPGFVAIFLAITLAAPLLAATNAPMDLVIVGFGLWEAWKLSRGLPLTLDGPYRAAPATGPAAG